MTNGILLFTIVSKQRQYFFVYSVYQFNGIYRFLQLIEYYPNFQGTVEFLMAFSRKEKSVNSIENFFSFTVPHSAMQSVFKESLCDAPQSL